jgi:hypothetical protein
MIPNWHATTAQQTIVGSRVELFDGAGHFPHLDEPERFAELLRDFTVTQLCPRTQFRLFTLRSSSCRTTGVSDTAGGRYPFSQQALSLTLENRVPHAASVY